MDLSPTIHVPHRQDKKKKGKIALSLGPLLYCFESIDNKADPREITIDLSKPINTKKLSDFNNIVALEAYSIGGDKITAIPYYTWGNRKKALKTKNVMTVWIHK